MRIHKIFKIKKDEPEPVPIWALSRARTWARARARAWARVWVRPVYVLAMAMQIHRTLRL